MSELYSFYTPHEPVVFECDSEMITKQSCRDECDINNILSQFSKTGIISHVNNSTASFVDLPDVSDFQHALAVVTEAEFAFSTLPSKLRERYSNDPALFLEALMDPSQVEFLTEVGVFRRRPDAKSGEPASPPEAVTGSPVGGG